MLSREKQERSSAYIVQVFLLNRTKGASAHLAAYGLLEKANAFSSCDAYAAEAFLVERFD